MEPQKSHSAGCGLDALSDDGLEREFNSFNQLEGGVCTMCAPREIKENLETTSEGSAELNALLCQRRAGASIGCDLVRQ
jgi:hypothetical protein